MTVTWITGTDYYVAKQNGLRKYDSSDGSSVSLSTDKRFVSLTNNGTVLWGADQDGIYSIHTTTGVATLVVDFRDVSELDYVSSTILLVIAGNSLYTVNPSTGAIAAISRDM